VRARRVALFAVIVGGALASVVVFRPHRPRGGERTPAGGVTDADGLVEDGRRYRVRSWSFPLARYEPIIEDVGMTTALDAVLERTHAELVVNGGFFDPDGKAVGLAVSRGAALSKMAKSLSGGVLVVEGERASLVATESFDAGAPFALQCRPRLVVDGKPNVKSDDGKRAERTALCVRDEGQTLTAYVVRGSDDDESPGPSLFALARHLAKEGCSSALNLDGGPSTGAAFREGGRTVLFAPRGPIRHAIVFRTR